MITQGSGPSIQQSDADHMIPSFNLDDPQTETLVYLIAFITRLTGDEPYSMHSDQLCWERWDRDEIRRDWITVDWHADYRQERTGDQVVVWVSPLDDDGPNPIERCVLDYCAERRGVRPYIDHFHRLNDSSTRGIRVKLEWPLTSGRWIIEVA
jgi:hypothetical protein